MADRCIVCDRWRARALTAEAELLAQRLPRGPRLALEALARADAGLDIGGVAEALPGERVRTAVNGLLNRLEAAGFARRVPRGLKGFTWHATGAGREALDTVRAWEALT